MNEAFVAVANGFSAGMAVFLVAAGLTLIYGVMRILNFAHGAFFMIGAYLAAMVVPHGGMTIVTWLLDAVLAGLAISVLGLVVDRLVLRRIRAADEHHMLIATFAVLLICEGATKLVWGVDIRSVDPPDGLDGAVVFAGTVIPSLSIAIAAVGVLVFVLLEAVLRHTRIGRLLQAIAFDPWMAQNLGLNVPFVFSSVVIAAFFLAGFAGGILLPNQSLSPSLADSMILQAFICIIVGGVGNIRGAFVAAILLGIVDSGGAVLLSNYPGIAVYITMIAFLLFRPQGIFAGGRT